ncbi:hypothetical protein NUSPORA_01627 [Nucleospora cyclopteri]
MNFIIQHILFMLCSSNPQNELDTNQEEPENLTDSSINVSVSQINTHSTTLLLDSDPYKILLQNFDNFQPGKQCYLNLRYLEPPNYHIFRLTFKLSMDSCMPKYYIHSHFQISIVLGRIDSLGNLRFKLCPTQGISTMLINPQDFLIWTFENIYDDDLVSVIAKHKSSSEKVIQIFAHNYRGNNCFKAKNILSIN